MQCEGGSKYLAGGDAFGLHLLMQRKGHVQSPSFARHSEENAIQLGIGRHPVPMTDTATITTLSHLTV